MVSNDDIREGDYIDYTPIEILMENKDVIANLEMSNPIIIIAK